METRITEVIVLFILLSLNLGLVYFYYYFQRTIGKRIIAENKKYDEEHGTFEQRLARYSEYCKKNNIKSGIVKN